MNPLASWTLVTIVVGLPTLILYCALRMASRASRAEERLRKSEIELQVAIQQMIARERQRKMAMGQSFEIDLDDFESADAIRVYFDGSDASRKH